MLRFWNTRKWIAAFLCAAMGQGCATARAQGAADLVGSGRWQAQAPSRPPRASSVRGGWVFDAPFGSRNEDRFYWDLDVSLDLSGFSVLELDVSCDRPEALRSLTVYFQSGEGWYAWGRPLARPGRQTLQMARTDFSAEGNAAGWDRITRIRLSPWRGAGVDARIELYGMRARRVPVLVLRGTRSSPNDGERRVAETVARRTSGWLDTMGIAHALAAEEDLSDALLAGVRTVVLPYNAVLPDPMLERLRVFVAGGGRLVVFYSADARLADLLGFRLGEYMRTGQPGRWSAIRFVDPAAWESPERVLQQSMNIRPAHPAGEGTSVIAWWEDAEGRRTEDPAWTAGPRGLWMSHVLNSDDAAGKAAMLAGLLTTLDPGLWPEVAAALADWCGRIDSFSGYAEASEAIRRQARRRREEPRVNGLLDEAGCIRARMDEQRRRRSFSGFLGDALRLRSVLTEAYARVQDPMAGEFRGVWDHGGAGWFPGDWDRSARILAKQGMTAIFPNLLWAGRAHFPTESVPGSDTLRLYGDQARASIDAARRHGLELHVWKVCWNLSAAPADLVDRFRAAGRLQTDARGQALPWLCPAHPDNIEYELAGLRDVVRTYAPDGVHLDYIRYPDADHCFSPVSRRAFEQRLGRAVPQWPADVRPGGALRAEYEAWRRDVMTAFVRRVRDELRALQPGIRISAAVFGGFEDARRSIGQDWVEWLRLGLVDFVVPMNYTDNLSRFSTLTGRQLAQARGLPGRVYPGIGVSSNEATLMPDQVIEQIVQGRRLGARGFVLFDLNVDLRDRTLPALRLGLTQPD